MLRWVWGASIVTLLFAVVITWEAKRCETASEQYQSTASANPFPGPVAGVPASPSSDTNKQQPPNQAGRAESHANSFLCLVLTPANLPTIYLVLIGAGGIVVAIGTLKILEEQTNAIKQSAELADKQLKLVAADVQIDATSLSPVGGMTPKSYVAVRLKNFGDTRAEKVRSYLKVIIPGVPDTEFSPETFTMAKGATQIVRFQEFGSFMRHETYMQIVNGAITVRLGGSVTYFDVFGEFHTVEVKEGILDPRRGVFNIGQTE